MPETSRQPSQKEMASKILKVLCQMPKINQVFYN